MIEIIHVTCLAQSEAHSMCSINLTSLWGPTQHTWLPTPQPEFTFALRAWLPLAFLPYIQIRRQVISINLIKMTHGLACTLQSLILFTVLREHAIITGAGTVFLITFLVKI